MKRGNKIVSDANKKLSVEIMKMALTSGADLAGLVDIESLKRSPSHRMYFKLPAYVSSEKFNDGHLPDKHEKNAFNWPPGARTLLIIALRHPQDAPALDYWREPFAGGTEGNLRLIRINNAIVKWLKINKEIIGVQIPYAVEQGGVCLKDAAVLAGLGTIGKNNLLVTPRFGPRVRLRALALPVELASSGPIDFDPCPSCDMPCRRVCPQGAFDQKLFSSRESGQAELPAREGVYARAACKVELTKNHAESDHLPLYGREVPIRVADYCRACEFACPVGK